STATTSRNLNATNGIAFLSTDISGSFATAKASVVGGPQNGDSKAQSPDSQTSSEKGFGANKAKSEDSKASKGTEGASTPSASDSNGSGSSSQVSVAGAICV